LGRLLADELEIELRRVGSGKRLTFSAGEERLSQWIGANARVAWHACDEPWKLEEKLISAVNLPINLDFSTVHAFCPVLSELRRAGRPESEGVAGSAEITFFGWLHVQKAIWLPSTPSRT